MKTSRELLLDVGVKNFNATMVIPFVLISPATTDPKSPPVMIMVEAIQKRLVELGAPIMVSKYLDHPTAAVLTKLMGPGWMNQSWADVIKAVMFAYHTGQSLAPATVAPVSAPAAPLSGPLDFLPDVPGGLLTYAIGGFLAYRYFTKNK